MRVDRKGQSTSLRRSVVACPSLEFVQRPMSDLFCSPIRIES